MSTLYEMPHGPPDDLAHARWRVRFFRHLVDEHRAHPFYRDEQWFREDADYASHLAEAEEALSDMETSPRYSSAPARPCMEQPHG